jgi:tetratricopeptide (TPR) repeat protein
MRPISETFSRPEGQFTFSGLVEGAYAVETFETETFLSATVEVLVRPLSRNRPITVTVIVELSPKPSLETAAPSELMADVDTNVPKEAQKKCRSGMKALEKGDSEKAVAELRAAVELHTTYYAARLALGRELRQQKDYQGAEAVLRPLLHIAPRRADPHTELGGVLLSLERRPEAVEELEKALRLREASWATHLYLGWALLETDGARAERHFSRAIEIDEHKAARAHLALARIAHERGQRQLAVRHLEAYLSLAPDAPDADSARKLADSLRMPD